MPHQTSNAFAFATNSACTPGPRYVPDRSVAPDAARYVLISFSPSLAAERAEALDSKSAVGLSARSAYRYARRRQIQRYGTACPWVIGSSFALRNFFRSQELCAVTHCYTAGRPFGAPIVLSASFLPSLITRCAMPCREPAQLFGVGPLLEPDDTHGGNTLPCRGRLVLDAVLACGPRTSSMSCS